MVYKRLDYFLDLFHIILLVPAPALGLPSTPLTEKCFHWGFILTEAQVTGCDVQNLNSNAPLSLQEAEKNKRKRMTKSNEEKEKNNSSLKAAAKLLKEL